MTKKKLGAQELSKASKATVSWQATKSGINTEQAKTAATERVFAASSKLISVTDIHGVIVDCNAAFMQVSGYSKAELLGKPHSVVRHPDMPAQTFKIMWQHLQAGKPWMGLVKNLCKNGDYYWVDAYITPITVKGQVVGYESVRSCPSRAAVYRAQKVYGLIQAKKSLLGWSVFKNDWIELLVLALATAGWLGWATTATQMLSGSLVLVGAYALVAKWRTRKALTALETHLAQSFSHPIAALTYIGDTSRLSQIKVGLLSQKAHLATVLTRIENAASQLHQKTAQTLDLTQASQQQISLQQAETAQVVALVQQMTSALMVVATQVTNAAQETDKAHVYIVRCNSIAQQTHAAIDELSQRVQSIRGSVVAVAEQINKITHSAQTIEQIADQTNLLALNAAIEAARAGDNGRGFAVVADEVRSLASVTQTSTQEIYTVLQELTTKAAEAVSVASLGAKQADQGLSNVAENSTMLNNIAQTVSQISNQASQVATVVEQQSAVAADINQQLNTIDALAVESCTSALQTNQSLQHLQQVADDLHELVSRFRE